MGGYGSGRHNSYATRQTVEGCLTLNVDRLVRDGMVGPRWWSGTLTWTRTSTGEKTASAGFRCFEDGEAHIVTLNYTVTHQDGEKHEVDQRIVLQTTRMPSGGLRWWFTCPLFKNGIRCGRRVGRLHIPTGGIYFGCRHCYNLTYTSCNESHKYDGLFRTLAKDMGTTPEMIKRALERKY